jgi:uncharacterized membrane protein YkvI
MSGEPTARPSLFQRFLLPGLAFKALVIGGGYATGREVAEFFLPSGPWGGIAAILLATILFSAGCALTFLFARATAALDYQSFFKALLGPGWVAWEIVYLLFVILILAVYGAAAGAIGAAVFGLPELAGTLALMAGITLFVTYGNKSVERLFEWVSYLLYAVYAAFFILAFTHFGDRIAAAFAAPAPSAGWALSGATYFSYNIIGAIVVLPVVRHMTSNRDAIVAGAICGPLTMLPALLESGASAVHAFNQRVDAAWQRHRGVALGPRARSLMSLALLAVCMFLAGRFGLIALIASGYRALAYILLAIFVLPLATIGVARILSSRSSGGDHVPA